MSLTKLIYKILIIILAISFPFHLAAQDSIFADHLPALTLTIGLIGGYSLRILDEQ